MKLRGFKSHTLTPVLSEINHVSCISTIEWLPNYETNGVSVITTDYANASILNCDERVSIKFLEAIAANRALVRNIRNFLGIYVVGEEELDTNPNRIAFNPEQNTSGSADIKSDTSFILKPQASLKKLVEEELHLNSFEKFIEIFHSSKTKTAIVKIYPQISEESQTWTGYDSVDFNTALLMIRALKKQIS